jgi:hypothetical protein
MIPGLASDELLGTDFIVMRLDFPQRGQDSKPTFSTLSLFTIPGPVMNVFLLDTAQRLSAAFVYIHDTRNIGLYCLLDWNKNEYVFIDTNIRCVRQSHLKLVYVMLILKNIVFPFQLVMHCTPRYNSNPLRRQGRCLSAFLPSRPPKAICPTVDIFITKSL